MFNSKKLLHFAYKYYIFADVELFKIRIMGKRFISVAIAGILLCLPACQDEFLANQAENENDIEIISRKESSDNGIMYQDRRFFTKGIDGKADMPTRSGGERMLKRTFSVHAENEGNYYLGVHLMPVGSVLEGVTSIQDVYVYVNSQLCGKLSQSKLEWEFVTLIGNSTIYLNQGNNDISFVSAAPYYPEIDAIQIESDFSKLTFNDVLYDDYIKFLRTSKNNSIEKTEQNVVDSELIKEKGIVQTRSVIDESYSWQVTPYTLSNPEGNYVHKLYVPVTYTYHRKLSLSAGNYTFHTSTVDDGSESSVDPVMCLYKIDDPHNYCYVNDDYSGMGTHSKIIANSLPAGDYYLVVRAFSSAFSTTTTGRQGLISVYQNDVQINTNCPVAGYSVDMTSSNTGTLNYFTAYSTGIPEFFLEERSTKKVKFFGATYFYMSDMDEMWFDDARMLLNKPSSSDKYNMVITACGAFGAYYGNCDVYGNCVQVGSDIKSYFPNLKQYDAIYSGTAATGVYNCAAWAGGITTSWVWNTSYGDPYVWDSWDNFFGNNPARYSGAVTYTRDNAHSGNAEIALWSLNGSISSVTHFSVRGTANNHPHGYAWESKPGSLRRMFHPMNALNGNSYGSIFAYYRDASEDTNGVSTRSVDTKQSLSFEESIEKGFTVIEDVKLSDAEKFLLSPSTRSAEEIPSNISEMKLLYSKWESAISTNGYQVISNPYELINIPEAMDFIKFCKDNKLSALAFFAELYFEDKNENTPKEVSQLMFCKIFEDFASVIEKIKEEWKRNPYNENGAYIAPLPETFVKKFVKELIGKI